MNAEGQVAVPPEDFSASLKTPELLLPTNQLNVMINLPKFIASIIQVC